MVGSGRDIPVWGAGGGGGAAAAETEEAEGAAGKVNMADAGG